MSDPEPSNVIPVAQSDLAGRQLGGYHLLRRLGRGAMSEVYLAEQISLRRHVALKILKANLAVQDSYVKRFQLEAQAAASLVHPNIVQIYEVGCADGLHFIAQEYVQGMNLHELLTRRGAPDLQLALAIMRQTAAALAKASERGIVHRDIKPENIMFSGHGEVKIADFGLARLSNAETRLTQEGYTLGTPLYMSPEQVEGKPLDVRSDIYSLGVTCYHMLAGQPPFHGDTALNVAVQHLKGTPDDLGELRPDLPPALCRLIHKMFARKPEDRCQRPRALGRAAGDRRGQRPGGRRRGSPADGQQLRRGADLARSGHAAVASLDGGDPNSQVGAARVATPGGRRRRGLCDRPGGGAAAAAHPAAGSDPPGRARQSGRGKSRRRQALGRRRRCARTFCRTALPGRRLRPKLAVRQCLLHGEADDFGLLPPQSRFPAAVRPAPWAMRPTFATIAGSPSKISQPPT